MFIGETDETDKIWIFPSIPNTDTMYINSGAICVHSATGVLTVRGDKQLSLRGVVTSGVRVLTQYFFQVLFKTFLSQFASQKQKYQK